MKIEKNRKELDKRWKNNEDELPIEDIKINCKQKR